MEGFFPLERGRNDSLIQGQIVRRGKSLNNSPLGQTHSATVVLGHLDGFDDDEAERERDDGSIVLGGLLAAERHTLEALELAHGLLNPSSRLVGFANNAGGLLALPL